MIPNIFKSAPSALLFTGLLLTSCAKPLANFSYNAATPRHAPAKVTFKNESKKATAYEWDFGDGTKTSDMAPSHEYKASGNYTITLIAKKGTKISKNMQQIIVEAPKDCLVEIETEFGNMTVLLSNGTPLHRDNFIKLVEQGFYNDLLFHRVINGFMVQGGDPNSRAAKPDAALGMGGPNYQIPAEFVDSLVHIKGALAAARTGDGGNPKKESSGSQFYIVQGRPVTDAQLDGMEAQKNKRYSTEQRKMYAEMGGTPFLDREYTVFGHVIQGLDVIDKIAAVQTSRGDRPAKDVKMKMKVVK